MGKVLVVGGGASGMTAAISAAREGAEVILLEQKERVGKKILSTGNGRCNFTNTRQEPTCYQSEDPEFAFKILRQFDMRQTIVFFQELGVYARERNGYLYPASDQASAVLDVLRMELKRLHVRIYTDTKCEKISPRACGFLVMTNKGNFKTDKIILAAGSRAAPSTGSDGSGYAIAKDLGHQILPVLPALVQLCCRETFYKSIAGVRAQGEIQLFAGKSCIAQDRGEIQLTEYGISGIPVFQVSSAAAKALYEKKPVKAVLNFMPDFEKQECMEFFRKRAQTRPEKTLEEFLVGMFHKKLINLWLRISSIDRSTPAGLLTEEELALLCSLIIKFETEIIGTKSFEQAQVCLGGVNTREVNADTLESRLVPGVYFAGEILDVTGKCGGYNLQWAWSSGFVAGREAAHA